MFRLIVVIISQYIQVSNHAVHLKLISITPQFKKKKILFMTVSKI